MSKKALKLVSGDVDINFEIPYLAYPRRGEGKKAGMDRLRKAISSLEDFERFSTAVNNYAALCKQEARERRFIKLWSTFVNQWEDYEIAEDLGLDDSKQSGFDKF